MDDGSCVVLVIHRTDPVLCYCRPGGSRWIRHEYRPESLVVDDRFGREKIIKAMAKLTAAGDAFYTFWDDKLATLQLSPEPRLSAFHVEDEPQRTNCYLVTRSRLVESCGKMFRVQFSYTKLCDRRIQRVEVHKLDRSTSTWVKKVTDLGNRVFFVSSGQFGASMAADELGLKPNCIYFSNPDDKGLYIYDMEQGTTSLRSPDPDVPDSMQPILLMPVT
ncbi:hypothetical protein ACP70R_006779 [Stipagrostis hirtigluma subsp. patula]